MLIIVLGLSANGFKFYAYVASFIYTTIILYSFVIKHKKIKQALKWKKINGTIVNSKKISKICLGSRKGRIYTIAVQYKYVIDQKMIYNNSWSIFKCENSSYSLEERDEVLKNMRLRNETEVFVNPKNKHEAYLNRYELINSEPLFINIFLTLLIVAAPLFFIAYFT